MIFIGCEEVPAQNYTCVTSSSDYQANATVPICDAEWSVDYLGNMYDNVLNETTFSYRVSVDPFKPNSGGSPAEALISFVLGIEKCLQASTFSVRTFDSNGIPDILDMGSDEPAQVDEDTCVNGIVFNYSQPSDSFGFYNISIAGNVSEGPVTYAVVGSNRFALGSVMGPNCECEAVVLIPENIIIPGMFLAQHEQNPFYRIGLNSKYDHKFGNKTRHSEWAKKI